MSVYYIMSVYTDRQLSMCHWEEYSFITWKNNNNNKTSTVKTFPQNHRMVRKDLWMSSSPALIKQGHPEQVTEDYVQNAFEDLQGR